MEDTNTRETETLKKNEVESLAFLLEDPDPFVYESVEKRLMELGPECVSLLDELRLHSSDAKQKERIASVIHKVTIESLEQEFVEYLENGVKTIEDLENGLFLLARFQEPTLDTGSYRRVLDRMASEVAEEVRYATDEHQRMNVILKYIYKHERFMGDSNDYFNPENSFIHRVIDRRRGVPISLAMVVLFVARRLNMPFYGVNMPMHFLLKFQAQQESVYLDPFNEGSIVSVDQCLYFLKKSGIKPADAHFNAATPVEMLSRSIRNLVNSYEKSNDSFRADELQRFLDYIESMYDNVQ